MKKVISYEFEEGDVVVQNQVNKVYIKTAVISRWRVSGDICPADDMVIEELLRNGEAFFLGNRVTGPDKG